MTFREDREKNLRRLLQKIHEEQPKENLKTMLEFYEAMRGQCAAGCMIRKLQFMELLVRLSRKSISRLNGRDFKDVIEKIEARYSEQTSFTYIGILKQFCSWYDDGRYWAFVSWKRRKRPKCAIKSSDLLTDEEMNKLIAGCSSPSWKAIIEGFYYSRCRPGEFLALRRKDVTLLESEIVIRPDAGKNKYADREVIVLENPQHFRRHVESVKNPESFLFPQMSHSNLNHYLNQISKAAGLKRRIWPYLFRHTRYTRDWELGMRVETRNALYGHSPGTKMNEYYLHLSRKSVSDDLRRIYAGNGTVNYRQSEKVVVVAPFLSTWSNN